MKEGFKTRNFIPPLFVQIYFLFFVSVCVSGTIIYLTNVNNLKKSEEAILVKTTFLAQQSLLEFISGNTARLHEIAKNNQYKIIRTMPPNAMILSEIQDSFAEIKIFKSQSYYGFYLEYLEMTFIAFKDYGRELSIENSLNFWILFDFLIQLLTFAILLALLHPLKILQSALREFTKGNYKIKIPVPKEPQQAQLALSFNAMSQKISKLMEAREFVLRNIGHELKTPISKAKLALEMMPENAQKSLVIKCVQNLDTLTSQILTFEKIQEGGDLLVWDNFNVETLIIEALQHLFIEEEEIEIQIQENFKIYGDLQFLSIGLKNLIANAKKYKSRGKIILEAKWENEFEKSENWGLESGVREAFVLSVCNVGVALKQPISYYFEPFSREDSHALIQGYGLGLAILKGVLELHHLGFSYQFVEMQRNPKTEGEAMQEGVHHFKIIFPKGSDNGSYRD